MLIQRVFVCPFFKVRHVVAQQMIGVLGGNTASVSKRDPIRKTKNDNIWSDQQIGVRLSSEQTVVVDTVEYGKKRGGNRREKEGSRGRGSEGTGSVIRSGEEFLLPCRDETLQSSEWKDPQPFGESVGRQFIFPSTVYCRI